MFQIGIPLLSDAPIPAIIAGAHQKHKAINNNGSGEITQDYNSEGSPVLHYRSNLEHKEKTC